jgi:phosphoribosylamine-glycine ligase
LVSKVKVKEFLLQEFITGTEISTEGWFNGTDFYALNHDMEEKKFLSGGHGPNTGCSGSVVWMPHLPNNLMSYGLLRTREALAQEGFVGPIDLNVIATEGQIFGLEWTPRFGYDAACNLSRLLPMEFGEFLYQIATGASPSVIPSKYPFAATIRLSVPPYPYEGKVGKYGPVPVKGIDLSHIDCCYLSDVRLLPDGTMETIGIDGFVGAPIGVGDSIKEAFADCEDFIGRLQIPDLQWRNDIGKCCEKRYAELSRNGWLRHSGVANA